MPTVNVVRDQLFKALGATYTKEEFELLCFEFGIELDDVTSEKEMEEKETGESSSASDEVIFKIDVPANRYDLLCIEGLSRALLVFLGKSPLPHYHISNAGPLQKLIVKPETQVVRPVVVAAVLRNITFTQDSYKSFIDLQEKLHQNICRKRSLVSIGTHDLDTIQGPFTYEALKPKDIKFAPLNMTTELDGEALFKHLKDTNSHLKKYLHIIENLPLFPVIYDKNRVVLSLPPIINGDHSKIRLTTKNVFIEVTATDYTKANIVLNTMVTMFAQYTNPQWSIENVEVQGVDGKIHLYPDISPRHQTATIDYINRCIGVHISNDDIVKLLNRMSLPAELVNGKEVLVNVPPTRSDILHACDIMEDVAIGYGFNKLPRAIPSTNTTGKPQPLSKLSDLLRVEVANAGYTEVLTWTLCSRDDNFKSLNRPDLGHAVSIDNPKTAEFQTGRLSLLSGILKSVYANQGHPRPLKIFEVGDVFQKDETADVGASNKRMLAALYGSALPGFEITHGLLDRLMLLLRIPHKTDKNDGYYIKPSEDPAFFPGRRVDIVVGDKKIGVMGVIHPLVLKEFDISFPCSALEIELTVWLAHWGEKQENELKRK